MATSLLILLDDIASVLDDVATMTKVAVKKTAGVLGDDLALNAKQMTGLRPGRELAVVWAVARGSVINKAILVPAAIAVSALVPWAITPLLIVGGAYLCFEGAEKILHRLLGAGHQGHESAHTGESHGGLAETAEAEPRKIAGAVRTDFILSAEIIVISLGVVAGQPLVTQVAVLVAISLAMTAGVYGLVAAIVKLDDLGVMLASHPLAAIRPFGRGLVAAAPWMIRGLSIAGTAAMFLVGGGIIAHGIPQLHHAIHDGLVSLGGAGHGPSLATTLLIMAAEATVGLAVGLALVATVAVVPRRRLVILFLATLPACLAARADDAAAARQSRADAVVAAPIRGICGDARAADAVARGANAVRTYSIPSRDALDRLHAAGLRVIPGVWMPHEGANKAKEGGTWNFSYAASGPKMLTDFAATLDRVGDHPAILMWTLGNEVHVSPEYLQQVERMSRLVHERFPRVLTSLTIVNAPPDTVRLVREHAPDIDVLGVNAYGQGAIANAIRFLEEHWDGLFYFSEFNATGPWWGPQASWGPRFEPSAPQKVDELRKAWAHMRASPRCAGGCLFQWGRWGAERITYFSSLLPADPFAAKAPEADLRFTPVADEIARLWAGKPPRRLAPVLERIAIGAESRKDITVEPGGKIRVSAVAVDADTPAEKLRYRWWIAHEHGGFRPLAGPVESAAPDAELTAPTDRDAAFFLVAVVLDDGDGICGTTLPFRTAK